MTRIDANVATQVADTSRPAQSVQESRNQQAEARRLDATASESRLKDAPTPEEIRAASERMQKVIETATGRQLDFAVDDRFKELVVKISDRASGEVLKEIPSKDLLALRARINDLIGVFIDEKA